MTVDGSPSAAQVAEHVARVRERIAGAGGDPDQIRLVAVTKGFGPDVVVAARGAGLVDLGENYAQELVAKAAQDALVDVRWHFLGRLQTNKVRHLAPIVSLWQSVDRADLVREIAKRAPGASILIQINIATEPQKGGCAFADVPVLVGLARDSGLQVAGFMAVGPTGPPEAARPGFERLVALADAFELPERSIGMTTDLEVAVAAGATMVRIGRALFGDRPPRATDPPR